MELFHHGIKGQKWGVRRYQNKDGTRTAEGKIRREYLEIGKIYNTLDEKSKRAVSYTDEPDTFLSYEDFVRNTNYGAKAFIKRYGGTPVAALYYGDSGEYASPTIMTNPKYSRKGYAQELLKRGEDWLKSNGVTETMWTCTIDNIPSSNLAIKSGYKKDTRSHGDIEVYTKKL